MAGATSHPPHNFGATHKYSQFNLRFIDYYPQSKDVIYRYLEVITSGAGTDQELRK